MDASFVYDRLIDKEELFKDADGDEEMFKSNFI